MALDLYIFYFYFRDLNLKLFQVMNMSEFYSDFLYRYQTEAAPLNVSFDSFCLREGVEYRNFIRWYRDNKKRLRESEMADIRISAIKVTGAPALTAPVNPPIAFCTVSEFHLKLSNGIEIHKPDSHLEDITNLLSSLSRVC